jgi:hypothetical protein
MLETNIRIVRYGSNLRLRARVLKFEGSELPPKLGEIAVSVLRKETRLASVVQDSSLLAMTSRPIRDVEQEKDGRRVVIQDTREIRELRFSNPADRALMTQLLERQLELRVSTLNCWWSLDSLRIWHAQDPFDAASGITARRRYELSAVVIDDVGIGLVVDVGTTFITQASVADFFVRGADGKSYRLDEFNRLTSRQKEQKGTLIYDNGLGKYKCWFEGWLDGMTVSNTGPITARRREYGSLYEYATQECRRNLTPDAPVARVSFNGLEGTQKVPAEWLQIRVMNDSVPGRLKNVDKLCPSERCHLIEGFWNKLGSNPLGHGLPGLEKGFWRPNKEKTLKLHIPSLIFGGDQLLEGTGTDSIGEIKKNFRQRGNYLAKYGCWYVPQTALRTVHLAIRRDCGELPASWLAAGIQARLSVWTKREISVEPICDDTLDGLKHKLRQLAEPGLAVIVFPDDDPATYFDLEYDLNEWRIKRITERQLARHAANLPDEEPDSEETDTGSSSWESFVDKCALDVLQLLDCIPYIPVSAPNYEARLGIDVGHTRRHFALSLVVRRPNGQAWQFRSETKVSGKADYKKEEINRKILADEIVKLAKHAVQAGIKEVNSLLGVRDGRECGGEAEAFEDARGEMEKCGFLSPSATIEVVDFHKNSVKGVRFWDRSLDGQIRQAVEGRGVLLTESSGVAQFTGAATLNQGTAEPVMLVARAGKVKKSIEDEFAMSQCNWASPSVAQRLPIELKRTDDELSHRLAQEVRRIR